jgi:acyl carrier protein
MGRLEDVLKEILKLDEVSDSTGPSNTKNWDSFNALMIVSKLEDEYDTSFSMAEVSGVRSVADIRKVLEKHFAVNWGDE